MDIVYAYSIGFFCSGLLALIVAVVASVKKAFSLSIASD